MKFTLVAAAAVVFVVAGFLFPVAPIEQGTVEVLATGLEIPWAMDFLPDGRLIFTERNGGLKVLEDGEVTLVSSVPVETQAESGLHGVAVDPDFALNGHVYIYYTYRSGEQVFNRVSRLTEMERNVFGEERVLLDEIPAARIHDGGAVAFGPDGLLYITAGDAGQAEYAQDLDSLAGKVLRIRKDGSLPENPFSSAVYSYGHRNPQGLAWDEDGQLYAAEHGHIGNDELNRIVAGGNYGWPIEECDASAFVGPIACFNPTLAPSGLAYHEGAFYLAGLRGAEIKRVSRGGEQDTYLSTFGRMRALKVKEGWLYFSTSNRDGRGLPREGDDQIGRIKI